MREAGEGKWRLSRRDLLIAAAVPFLATGAAAGAVRGESLRTLLDRVSALGDRAGRLAALRAAGTRGLAQPDRIIVGMIVRGIEREEALRHRFPFGNADGTSPYVVSQRHGAYLQIRSGPERGRRGRARDRARDGSAPRPSSARGIAPPAFLIDAVLAAERALASGDLPRDLRAPLVPADRGAGAASVRCRGGTGSLAASRRLRLLRASDPLHRGHGRSRRSKWSAGSGPRRSGLWPVPMAILAGLGLSQGSVGARLRALKRRPDYLLLQ